jgi:hypothetical protein
MSFEWAHVLEDFPEIIGPNTVLPNGSGTESDEWAVVYGGCVLYGPKPALITSLVRVLAAFMGYATAEHLNAPHHDVLELGCPTCETEQTSHPDPPLKALPRGADAV